MDLKDATLMMLIESADHPVVASLAQSAYDRLMNEEPVDYRLLNDLIGEASGRTPFFLMSPGPRNCVARAKRKGF